jgi:hypothetical protein
MNTLAVEFWWALEKLSGNLWDLVCPYDQASCWLDWLPAFCYRQRTKAERKRWERQERRREKV